MIDLDPQARALIAAARGGDDPTPSERSQVLAGFHARRRQGEQSVPNDVAPWSQLRVQLPRRRNRLLPWAVAAVVLTGSLGAFASWGPVRARVVSLVDDLREAIAPAPTPTPVPAPAPKRRTPPTSPLLAPVAPVQPPANEVLEVAPAADTPHGEALPSTRGSKASSRRPTATLDTPPAALAPNPRRAPIAAELALVSKARDALARADYARAHSLALQHGQEFPAGELALERQTILALAECRQTGDTRLARQLVQRYPGSLFSPRIVRDCGLRSNSVPAYTSPATHPSSADPSPGTERKP